MLKRVSIPIALLALSLTFAPSTLRAEEGMPTTRDLTSVRAAGMGGAVRGFASGNEALLVNPAGIAASTRLNIAGSLFIDSKHRYQVLGIDAVDSQLNAPDPTPLSGAVGYYNYRSGDGAARRTGNLIAAALAIPISELVFAGITAKYFDLSKPVSTSAVSMDAALMIIPVPNLTLSGVGYNLIDVSSPEVRRSYAAGVAYGSDSSFRVDVDVLFEENGAGENVQSYAAGAELLLANVLAPRLGFFEDGLRESRSVTGGLSLLVGNVVIIEAAYRHSINGKGREFALGLRSTNL